MPLDRHQQVSRVWDWLPAFRAAAEYESLQRAGLALSVSPSALSRSIKLLEHTLGLKLFTRSPSGLTLTEGGRRLLTVTREAMRLVHGGLPNLTPHRLRAGAVGPALPRLLCEAALDVLVNWDLTFNEVAQGDAGEQLRCGDLDVVLTHQALLGPGLTNQALPMLELVLAVGPGGTADKVGCLSEPGFEWPAATTRASSLDQLLLLVERLGISLFGPRYAVPPGWLVLERQSPRPVFLVARAYEAQAPAFIARLTQSLGTRLAPDLVHGPSA